MLSRSFTIANNILRERTSCEKVTENAIYHPGWIGLKDFINSGGNMLIFYWTESEKDVNVRIIKFLVVSWKKINSLKAVSHYVVRKMQMVWSNWLIKLSNLISFKALTCCCSLVAFSLYVNSKLKVWLFIQDFSRSYLITVLWFIWCWPLNHEAEATHTDLWITCFIAWSSCNVCVKYVKNVTH